MVAGWYSLYSGLLLSILLTLMMMMMMVLLSPSRHNTSLTRSMESEYYYCVKYESCEQDLKMKRERNQTLLKGLWDWISCAKCWIRERNRSFSDITHLNKLKEGCNRLLLARLLMWPQTDFLRWLYRMFHLALSVCEARISQPRGKAICQVITGLPKGNNTSRPPVIHLPLFKHLSSSD